MKRTKLVAVNDRGRRIGQDHPRAKLTDHEVDLIRQLAEEGMSSYAIAEKFEINPRTARRIISCDKRAHTPEKFKRVLVGEPELTE